MLRLGLTHFQSAMLIIVMQTCFILMNVLMKNVNINLLFGIDLLLGVLLVWQLDRMGDRRERKGKGVAVRRLPFFKKMRIICL